MTYKIFHKSKYMIYYNYKKLTATIKFDNINIVPKYNKLLLCNNKTNYYLKQ